TVVTAATVTAALWLFVGMSPEYALLLGVMLAPTDPVSVLVTMKEHGVAGGLRTLLEGESVFNDAIGIVLFVIAFDIAFSDAAGHDVSIVNVAREFFSEVAIGATVGLVLGFAIHHLMRLLDDRFVEITLSVTISFGAFLIADQLGGSGVLAVVAGGLLIGNYGMHRAMAPASQAALTEFWEMVAFLLNSALFLLIGLHFEAQRLFEGPTAAAVGVGLCGLLAGRAISVYGLLWPFRRSRGVAVPSAWRHAVYWGGLRGSIPVALVLGLTGAQRELDGVDAVAVVFALVLLSLVGQGLTFAPLLERLDLGNKADSTIAAGPLSGLAGCDPGGGLG
ncbi:MAG: sodium:proton antiporter, partial [Anaerolineaceae bacterium]